jgi:hypothetical protein
MSNVRCLGGQQHRRDSGSQKPTFERTAAWRGPKSARALPAGIMWGWIVMLSQKHFFTAYGFIVCHAGECERLQGSAVRRASTGALSLIVQLNGELSLKKGQSSLRFARARPRANRFLFRLRFFSSQGSGDTDG